MKNFTQIITFISVLAIVIFTSIIGIFAIINSCENNQTTKDNKIIDLDISEALSMPRNFDERLHEIAHILSL